MTHPNLITTFRKHGLKPGENVYLRDDETAMDFSVWRLQAGDTLELGDPECEVAAVVITGAGRMQIADGGTDFARPDWRDYEPTTMHLPAEEWGVIEAIEETDVAVVNTFNLASFPAKIYTDDEVDVEHRGRGQLDDACYRLVKLVFDRTIAPANARLVIGEVVNFAGRWSSYPPHHHRQPELYYYRFSPEHGYGHSELGDDVMKVKTNDLLKITGARDHAQTSAPGFDMYYLWAIRHEDNDPYTGFEYTKPYDTLLK